MYSPLEQFKIIPFLRIDSALLGIDITISNTTIFMGLAIIFIILVLSLSKTEKIIGNKWVYGIEALYTTVEKEIKSILGEKGYKYIPFLFSIFLFILMNNLVGLVPYSFTTTSQFIVTFTLSLSLFIGYTIIGIIRHGLHFFSLFVPSGIPIFILPFIILIEIISYFTRIISLAVRLTANMISGHILLHIIAGFGFKLTNVSSILLAIPAFVLFFIFGLELFVSLIQAYIFTILLTIYIKDSEYLH